MKSKTTMTTTQTPLIKQLPTNHYGQAQYNVNNSHQSKQHTCTIPRWPSLHNKIITNLSIKTTEKFFQLYDLNCIQYTIDEIRHATLWWIYTNTQSPISSINHKVGVK